MNLRLLPDRPPDVELLEATSVSKSFRTRTRREACTILSRQRVDSIKVVHSVGGGLALVDAGLLVGGAVQLVISAGVGLAGDVLLGCADVLVAGAVHHAIGPTVVSAEVLLEFGEKRCRVRNVDVAIDVECDVQALQKLRSKKMHMAWRRSAARAATVSP